MFAFKKTLAVFCFPVAMLGFLLAAGVVLLWWKGGQAGNRWGKRVLTGGVVLYWVLGSSWFGDLVLWPLLSQHERLDVEELRAERGADWSPDYLVVLAAGHVPDRNLPAAMRLTERSLARVHEAFRLHREFPEARIICTGGRIFPGFEPISRDMAAALRDWGVGEELLITEEESRDTEDHVKYLRAELEGKSFVLVTSNTHMPRSLALFRRAGLEPVAAPEPGQRLREWNWRNWWRGVVPNSGNFGRVEAAAYEYLGLAWVKVRGRI